MIDSAIESLEHEWEQDTGFFGLMRQGRLCGKGLSRVLTILDGISLDNSEYINRKLVEILWYIPTFMIWQKSRLISVNEQEFESAITEITNRLEDILGVP
ncbi:MAG: hypothetical protein HWD86_07785 [Kangiellaceae bacterium]|nr:hypothetical protein [Kangiellaceae bacterium]